MKTKSLQQIITTGEDKYKIKRIPGIIATDKGTLIIYYECRYGESDWSVIDIAIKRSTDFGKTWSNEVYIAEGKGKNTLNNPVMFVDGEKIHLIWFENYKRAFYQSSMDDGITWTEVKEITNALESIRNDCDWSMIAAGPGHGTVLKNGMLIVPVWMGVNKEDTTKPTLSFISTMYSKDGGESWNMGEVVPTDGVLNPNESALAEIADGRILLNIRNQSQDKKRCLAYSDNGFSNWNDIHFDNTLNDPGCEGGMCQSDTGVLFTNCNSVVNRLCMTISRTVDDGKTWEQMLIEERGGYSDICYNKFSKTAFIIYEIITSNGVEGMNFGEIEL